MEALIGSEPTLAGVGSVVFGVVLGLAAALVLRNLLAPPAVAVLLALAGAALGWGGILLQPEPSAPEAVLAVVSLAVLVPVHVRVVLGPFGPRRSGGDGDE